MDRQTNRRRQGLSMYRASIASRGKIMLSIRIKFLSFVEFNLCTFVAGSIDAKTMMIFMQITRR